MIIIQMMIIILQIETTLLAVSNSWLREQSRLGRASVEVTERFPLSLCLLRLDPFIDEQGRPMQRGPDESCEVVVIGGGFYGLYLAEYLSTRAGRVILFEREPDLMRRASHANQARVHNGYHYPRSALTAGRSRANFPRFVDEFRPAIDTTFEMVYGVGRRFSKITADQFYASIRRIGAPIWPAPKNVAAMFDTACVEAAFLVREYAFNATTLREILSARARRAGVDVRLRTTARAVHPAPGPAVRVETESPTGAGAVVAKQVFCCGYAQLNAAGAGGRLPLVALKHELAELALVQVPDQLRGYGVTVMDGPFFSLMPFPASGLHTLSHVRYTPHAHWYDGPGEYRPAYQLLDQAAKRSAFPHMVRDAARYLPLAADCLYRDSLWEVKTVLPKSETDDSRPILFRPDFGLHNYHLILGGKIDNIYDVIDVIGRRFGWPPG
jgi:glycine/D-amino acid oxidase-like deaminating enzyme